FLSGAEPVPARPDARDVARRADAALVRHLSDKSPLPSQTDDEAFLRRLYLDLSGKLPGAEEVRSFAVSTDSNKRARQIDRLLESDAYAVNWGRYWRDVLTYHTPASGNYLRWDLFDTWMIDQLRQNRTWGEIVTSLVTAVGINDETAPVNFLTSHFGNPVESAA